MVPVGVAETSQWYRKASRVVPSYNRMQDNYPPTDRGIAVASRAARPAPVCKTQANSQTMVSPEHPICADVPFRPDGWYRRSVPTVEAQPCTARLLHTTNVGIARASRTCPTCQMYVTTGGFEQVRFYPL